MSSGTVRSFNEEEGYGFIEADSGERLFVHHSAIVMEGFRTLSRGERVTFTIERGKRGPEAKDVRRSG